MNFNPFRSSIWGSEFFSGDTKYRAKVTTDGELATSVTERERNVFVCYSGGVIDTADVYSVLIDKSDTTNFPHNQTGRIDLSSLAIQIDKTSNLLGSIKIGVITRIDGTNADIQNFAVLKFDRSSATLLQVSSIFSPSQLKTGLVSGVPNRFLTNDTESDVAAVNTGASLDSPNGSINPGLGDIIVKQGYTSGTSYQAVVASFYHGEATA